MSIVASCQCGSRFAAEPHLAGKRVQCPNCGGPLTIPSADVPQGIHDPLASAQPFVGSPAPIYQQMASSHGYQQSSANRGLTRSQIKTIVILASVITVLVVLTIVIRSAVLTYGPYIGIGKSGPLSYRSKIGNFSANIPRPVTESVSKDSGWHYVTHQTVVNGKVTAIFRLCFLSRPNRTETDRTNNALFVENITLRNAETRTEVTISGYRGFEYQLTSVFGFRHGIVCLSDDVMYEIYWEGPREEEPKELVREMLDSFEIHPS